MYSALRGLGTVDHCGHDGWILIAQVKATGPDPVELKYLASSLRKLHSQEGNGIMDLRCAWHHLRFDVPFKSFTGAGQAVRRRYAMPLCRNHECLRVFEWVSWPLIRKNRFCPRVSTMYSQLSGFHSSSILILTLECRSLSSVENVCTYSWAAIASWRHVFFVVISTEPTALNDKCKLEGCSNQALQVRNLDLSVAWFKMPLQYLPKCHIFFMKIINISININHKLLLSQV